MIVIKGVSTQMLNSLRNAEVPLAIGTFSLAIIVILWKTVGLSFVPGWDAIWGGRGFQYPRRPGDEVFWHAMYLGMYGILGAAAQYAGLQISIDKLNRSAIVSTANKQRARLLGFFHLVIAIHHFGWSVTRKWGRLELDEFTVPGGYAIAGIVGVWTGWHGVQLLLTSSTTTLDKVIRHKTLVDACSLMTLIELVAFLPANWVGFRDHAFESVAWTVTFYLPLLMFIADAYDASHAAKPAQK